MMKLIWLIPLLPLAGAAVNGLLGRRFRFSERVVGAVAVGACALSFLIGVAAVYEYGFGGHARWPAPYVTSEEGGFPYSHRWIPGGAVELTQGKAERFLASTSKVTAERAERIAREQGLPPGSAVLVSGGSFDPSKVEGAF